MINKSEHNTHQTPRQRQFAKVTYKAIYRHIGRILPNPFFLLNRRDFYL